MRHFLQNFLPNYIELVMIYQLDGEQEQYNDSMELLRYKAHQYSTAKLFCAVKHNC